MSDISTLLLAYSANAAHMLEQMRSLWVGYQVIAIIVAFMLCYVAAAAASQPVEKLLDHPAFNWLGSKRAVLERLAPVAFLLLLWLELAVFRTVTIPANTLLLNLITKLTFAWVVINIMASVIRNRFVFRVVSISLWLFAALSILGLLGPLATIMDTTTFHLGHSQISLLKLFKGGVVIVALVWGISLFSQTVERMLGTADISPSMKVLLGKLVRIVLMVGAVIVGLDAAGIDLTTFAIFSGAVGVGLGFGLQKTVSNFISGISLLLDKSIKPGDVISIGDTFGWISQINTRYTSVVTRNGREHLIPNENLITQEVINWSYTNDKVRIEIPFGVTYEANPHHVKKLVLEKIGSLPRVLNSPSPNVLLKEFGESSLKFAIRVWIRDPAEGVSNIQSEVLFAVWDVLRENNIEIPYPKRDLYAPQGLKVTLTKE